MNNSHPQKISNPLRPELPSDYYHTNFLELIHTVSEQYADLLREEEQHWVDTFNQLTHTAQQLYIRLLSRKGDIYRQGKLHYTEINNIPKACQQLANAELISVISEHSPHIDTLRPRVFNLFTKPELVSKFPHILVKKDLPKPKIIDLLCKENIEINACGESIIQVSHPQFLTTFLLCFFGNTHQTLSQFVISDLGIQQFETYTIDRNTRFFKHRRDMESWLLLSSLNEAYWQAKQEKNTEQFNKLLTQLPPPFSWAKLERKRCRLLNHLARELERQAGSDSTKLKAALALYKQNDLPPSRERQVRILDKLGEHAEADSIAKEMLASPQNEEERDTATRLCRNLARQLKRPFTPATKPPITQSKLSIPNTDLRVERAVADYYEQQGWQAYYVENTLFTALFGLLFWDIIFSPVEGAFQNRFQRSPYDMFSSEFYPTRQKAIDHRLDMLETGQWQNWSVVYQSKYGISNDWVAWHLVSSTLVDQATALLSPQALSGIFRRILFDPRNNRSGFPDLILISTDNIKLVEVKGPGDKLQHNQIRWFETFTELGIPAEVAYVEWI
ncbi:hypothetical protein ABT56_01300 [Photobacterium aquae]|uniref:phosphodiesterase I n=1 Tax=Photobacterium aquae TaxID=1195763 RepID=A0A0J1K392_9GAMM|nr:VRR-NUC domain-containing protein [Photobacterium aquae]KLV08882.1 hypothetical protein ABT56_01300 [Photobacterium aquae]